MAIAHHDTPNQGSQVCSADFRKPPLDPADAIEQITDRENILISDNNAHEVVRRALHLVAVSRAVTKSDSGVDVIPLNRHHN